MSARAQAARGYRMRPAPRRGRRSAASRIHWDKLGRVVLVLVFFLVLAWYVNPAMNFFDAWHDSRTERENLADLRAENAELRERAAGLEGPDAEERAARRLGMVAAHHRGEPEDHPAEEQRRLVPIRRDDGGGDARDLPHRGDVRALPGRGRRLHEQLGRADDVIRSHGRGRRDQRGDRVPGPAPA